MTEWLTDPKSISLIAAATFSVVISVWQGKQTAAVAADLVKWRLERADPALERHETRLHTAEQEINRLRDLQGGR